MAISIDLFTSLANLYKSDSDSDLIDIESLPMPHKLKVAVRRKLEQEEDRVVEEYASSIIEILSAKKAHISSLVASVRKLRADERDILASIKEMEDLEKTALETNDWIPLISKLRLNVTGGAVLSPFHVSV